MLSRNILKNEFYMVNFKVCTFTTRNDIGLLTMFYFESCLNECIFRESIHIILHCTSILIVIVM